MRKFLYSIAAMLMFTATAAVFTACSDDDDKTKDEPQTEKTIKESTLTTTLYVNQAMADTYDILSQGLSLSDEATEVDFNGSKTPMYSMTLESTSTTVPLTSVMNVSFTIKDGYTVPDKSDFALKIVVSGTVTYTDGTNANIASKNIEMANTGVFGDKIEQYTASLNKNYGCIKAILNAEGIELTTSTEE